MRRRSIESRIGRSRGWPFSVVAVAMLGICFVWNFGGRYLFCAVAVKLRVEVDRGVYCIRVRAALAKLQKGRIHLIFI